MLELRLDKQPAHFLQTCEKELFERLKQKLVSLCGTEVPHDAKRVVGYPLPTFRVRVGKYRILYRINYTEQRIVVVKIDHREKVY
jgi:mRNA interferase RelE/StbE